MKTKPSSKKKSKRRSSILRSIKLYPKKLQTKDTGRWGLTGY